MEKNKRREARRETFFIVVMCLLGVILGFCVNEIYDNYKINEGVEEISDYVQCSNLSLEDTSECLRKYISTFYNYTIRDDEIRTIEDIKINGGDCYDYNKLYERLGKELGFGTFSFRIGMGDKFHRIAIISDETGYCLLDQLNKINCFNAGGLNEE